jgi:hypothetical protein
MARTIRLRPGAHVAVVAGRVVDLPAGAVPAALVPAVVAAVVLARSVRSGRGRLPATITAAAAAALAGVALTAARRPGEETLLRHAATHQPRRRGLRQTPPPVSGTRS